MITIYKYFSNFHPFEVVGRGTDSQPHVDGNFNLITLTWVNVLFLSLDRIRLQVATRWEVTEMLL